MKNKFFKSFSLIVSIAVLVSLVPISVSATQVTQPLVSVYSNHINDVAAYEVSFYTADTEASGLVGNNGDNIVIQFPQETILPSSISNSNVKVNNKVLNQGVIFINTNTKTVTMPLPKDMVIEKNSFVKIDIAQEAGIKNPSTSGSYIIGISTSSDSTVQTSAEYSILDSMITVPDVTVTPNIIGEAGAYIIDFNVSSKGSLVTNSDSIYIFFPLGTNVPSIINGSNIKVNNIPMTTNPSITNNPEITGDPDSRYRMKINVPTNIPADGKVHIEINPNANIVHPTTQDDYNLEIWTSKDTVKNKSVAYEIAEAISETTVWVSPDIAGQTGQYSIAIENGNKQLNVGDTITIQFPVGTVFTNTSTNIKNYVFIDGVKVSDIPSANVVVDTNTLTMTIKPQKVVEPRGIINILFIQNAGIQNPLKESNTYFLNVKTTNDIAYRPSSAYMIQGKHIPNLTAQLTNDGIGLNGEYLIQFKVSDFGGLVGGQDTVTITFPKDTIMPSSLTYSQITVNDKPLTQNVTVSGLNRILQLTIPNDLVIPRNGNVTIKIPQSVAIKNPSTVGNYTLDAYTSRDPVAIVSDPYIIGKQIKTPTIAVSPNTYNTSAQYAIGFYTSDQGAISSAQNDYIEIVFPNGTVLPSYINASNIKINGINATSANVSSMKLKIGLPSGMSISNDGYVGIVIDSSAGIRNPVGGTYKLNVSTSKDKALVPSGNYTTVGTKPSTGTTTPSGATNNTTSVKLSSLLTNDIPSYEITYKTSSTGALEGGIDEIIILFDSRIEVPGYISKETIKVNGIQVNSGWVRRNGQSIVFQVPTTVKISNNQTITITIDKKAEIANPASMGTYGINVMTSKDKTPAGTSYTLQGSGGNQFIITPQYNPDKSISRYTMLYTTGSNGSLRGGYDSVTIMLPVTNTTALRDNINITVNGYNVPSNQIEVSGKNISFLLPYNLNIGNNEHLIVVIEDPKHMTLPKTTGNVVFYMSTSKETYLTSSNSISILKSEVTGTDQGSEKTEDKKNEPDQKTDINIKLYVGSKIAYVDGIKENLLAAPIIENITTMVPLRFITETLGGYADYNEKEKRIVIIYNEEYLIFTLGSKTVYTIDDELQLPEAPKVINGTTLVPLRFITEWMGIETIWNGSEKSITLKK